MVILNFIHPFVIIMSVSLLLHQIEISATENYENLCLCIRCTLTVSSETRAIVSRILKFTKK